MILLTLTSFYIEQFLFSGYNVNYTLQMQQTQPLERLHQTSCKTGKKGKEHLRYAET